MTSDAVNGTDDTPAWDALAEDVRRYVHRRIADAHAAEDVAQDVFVKLARQLQAAPPDGPLHAWVFRVARNAVVDHHRARRTGSRLPEDVAAPDEAAAGTPDAAPLFASFRRFVHALPSEQREAILLTEYDGLTQQQLAQRLGIPVSTVKSRVQRGRKRLLQLLHDCCTFEFDRRGRLLDWQRRPGGGGCGDCDC